MTDLREKGIVTTREVTEIEIKIAIKQTIGMKAVATENVKEIGTKSFLIT